MSLPLCVSSKREVECHVWGIKVSAVCHEHVQKLASHCISLQFATSPALLLHPAAPPLPQPAAPPALCSHPLHTPCISQPPTVPLRPPLPTFTPCHPPMHPTPPRSHLIHCHGHGWGQLGQHAGCATCGEGQTGQKSMRPPCRMQWAEMQNVTSLPMCHCAIVPICMRQIAC